LSGTLVIIGLAPQNDSHIFSCINKSNISNVVFYNYFEAKGDKEIKAEIKNMSLPVNKPYVNKDVKNIWDKIKVYKPNKQNYNLSEKQLEILNAICIKNPIAKDDTLCN
jgi:hypothetical protein